MNALFTILAAFTIGYFVRTRSTAVLGYLVADAIVFSYQNVDVMLNWMGGNGGIGGAKAFGPFPTEFPITYSETEVISYGIVNLAIVVAGIGLTVLGNWVRARRSAPVVAADS